MDSHILFQKLVYARHQLGPYAGFEGWEDEKLWDTLAFRVRANKSIIVRALKSYKHMYSLDNTLSMLHPSLKKNVPMVFGSVLGNLDVDIVEKVLQEDGALPSLPLAPYPIGLYQPTHYPSSSDSGETKHVTYSLRNPEMDQLIEKARAHQRKIGDSVDVVDGLMVETEQEQKIIPSQSSSRNKNFMDELGYTCAFSRRYGEDLKSLNLTGEQIIDLLTYCLPNSSKYHALLTYPLILEDMHSLLF